MDNICSKLTIFAASTVLALTTVNAKSAEAASFTELFDPSNFDLVNNNADGAVDTAGAPSFFTLTGGNNLSGDFGTTDYLTTAAAGGEVSFDWNYLSFNSSPEFDPFGFVLNDTFTQLTDSSGSVIQAGAFNTSVEEGDSFGWQIATFDNGFGAAQATITNFKFAQAEPEPTPEPASVLGLLALGAAGASSTLRRQKQEQ